MNLDTRLADITLGDVVGVALVVGVPLFLWHFVSAKDLTLAAHTFYWATGLLVALLLAMLGPLLLFVVFKFAQSRYLVSRHGESFQIKKREVSTLLLLAPGPLLFWLAVALRWSSFQPTYSFLWDTVWSVIVLWSITIMIARGVWVLTEKAMTVLRGARAWLRGTE